MIKNAKLILLGIIILMLNSCIKKHFEYRLPFKESLLKVNDTIEGFFLFEQYLDAYIGNGVIVQAQSLIPVNKNNEIEDYGTIYSLDFIRQSKFYKGTDLDTSYIENGLDLAYEVINDSTTIRPFCGTSYKLCKVKMIINKGISKKRRVPLLLDCDQYQDLLDRKKNVYAIRKVKVFDILGVISYEMVKGSVSR